MTTRHANGPGASRAVTENQVGGGSASIVAQDLTQHPAFRAGYLSGAVAGWLDGYSAAETDMAAAWRPVAERVRRLGSPQSVPWGEVQRRRAERAVARPVPTYAECMASWGDAA